MSSFAEHMLVVGSVGQQFLRYVMFIRPYSSKDGIVTIGNQLLHVRSICWVQISPKSAADKRLKTLFLSRRTWYISTRH